MPSGRSPEIAKRNAKIKRAYDNGTLPGKLAEKYNLSRQQIHVIVSTPDSDQATVRQARQVVRPLEKLPRKYKGIQHGSEAGYREELRRGLTTCDDCKTAHAVVVAEYSSQVKSKAKR